MDTWQLQEAKAKLSELIKRTKDRPQTITLHGTPVAVVISKDEYEKLSQPRQGFVEFMRRSPLYGVDLDVSREQTLTEGIDLE